MVDTATLAPDELRALEALVAASGFWSTADAPPGPPPGPDAFTYALTIDDGPRRRTVRLAESNVPEPLRALIAWLMQRVPTRSA